MQSPRISNDKNDPPSRLRASGFRLVLIRVRNPANVATWPDRLPVSQRQVTRACRSSVAVIVLEQVNRIEEILSTIERPESAAAYTSPWQLQFALSRRPPSTVTLLLRTRGLYPPRALDADLVWYVHKRVNELRRCIALATTHGSKTQ